MRFLAHEQDGRCTLLTAPDGEVEDQSAEHGHHRRGNVRGDARHVDDRNRLAVGWHAENLGDEIGHRVGHQHAGEHELVPRVALDLVELVLDPHVRGGVGRFVELAHPVLNFVRQVGQEIGNGGIDRDLAHAFGKAAFLAGLEQTARQNVGIDLALITVAGEQHFAMLFEIHDPVRHLEVRDVEDHTGMAERRRIFAVRIDHDDMPLGRRLADTVQQQGRAGRFAGAGRTQQRKVLPEHGIDIDARTDVLRGIDLADRYRAASVARIDLLEVLRRRGIDHPARNGIACHTAAEAMELSGQLLLDPFAEKINIGEDGPCLAILALIANAGEKPAIADADLDLRTDLSGHRDRWIVIFGALVEALQVDGNHRTRAGDLQHHANGLGGILADRFFFCGAFNSIRLALRRKVRRARRRVSQRWCNAFDRRNGFDRHRLVRCHIRARLRLMNISRRGYIWSGLFGAAPDPVP